MQNTSPPFIRSKYNQVIIGFLYIAAHDGQDFAPEELRYLEKICYYSSYALRNANLYQNAYRCIYYR